MTAIALPQRRVWVPAALAEHLRAWWHVWIFIGVLAALVLYPLVMLFLSSFRTGADGQPVAFSLDSYARVFSSAATYQLIWTTVWLAAATVCQSSPRSRPGRGR